MGTRQALKALSVLPSGGKIIGKLVLYTAPELSEKKILKQNSKFQKKVNHIFKILDKKYKHKTPFIFLFWFASFKASHEKYKKGLPADYEFYMDKEYFTDTKLSLFQKLIIKCFTRLFQSILT